jgi:DinB superfamily
VTIPPDTKDWTWVLRERCPECGFESSSLVCADIGAMLRVNAAAWRDVLRRSDVRDRPSPTTWSALEYACHVRDVYALYDERLRLMLTEDDPLYPNWDQDSTAVADRYREQDPALVADEIIAAAAKVAARFDLVHDEQWQRTGRRSDGASFTVEAFARYFTHDWIHHLWDVTDARQA